LPPLCDFETPSKRGFSRFMKRKLSETKMDKRTLRGSPEATQGSQAKASEEVQRGMIVGGAICYDALRSGRFNN